MPSLPTKNLLSDPHHIVILTILFRGQEYGNAASSLVVEETLFNETKVWKIPVLYKDAATAGQELTPVTFSRLIASLIRWNLIRRSPIRTMIRKNCTASPRMASWRYSYIQPV